MTPCVKRPQGKQRGAKGSGLKMSPAPDKVIDHRPPRCEDCGAEFADDSDSGFTARQVIDLPEVTPVVTEHRAHTYTCACGHRTTARFPSDVRAPVSYGPGHGNRHLGHLTERLSLLCCRLPRAWL